MPKISKVKVPTNTRPGEAPPPKETLDKYQCSRCGRIYKHQKNNFSTSHSMIFRGGGGYLPICNICLDELLQHYKNALGSEAEAIRRLCLKFDIYWNPDLYDMVYKANTTGSRIRSYISKTNLLKYLEKTFDDTIDEEEALRLEMLEREKSKEPPASVVPEQVDTDQKENSDIVDTIDIPSPAQESIDFWGAGFSIDTYEELDRRYARWTGDLEQPLDNSTEALYRNICILEVTINRNAILGKPIEQSMNALNNLMGSANIKPVQKKQEDVQDVSFDNMSFGMGIKMFENIRPVPKPIPELEDVDGVIRYISIWFLGHLCKMLGIRNTYCKLYEDEMERLKVERQVDDEEDDEGAFNDIFGDTGGE